MEQQKNKFELNLEQELKDLNIKPKNINIPELTEIKNPINFDVFKFIKDDLIFEIIEKHGEIKIGISNYKENEDSSFRLANLNSKDIFNIKTRNELIRFYKKNKKDLSQDIINNIINELYKEYQIWLSLKVQQINIKKEEIIEEYIKPEIIIKPENIPKDILPIIKNWDNLFSVYSFNNPEYSRASLHLLLGQITKKCRIFKSGRYTDPRISILYFKPTFSGGSAGYDIVDEIGREIGLKINTVADASDAALIGSADRTKNEETEEYEIEYNPGLLDKNISDIIYWGEPSTLFKKNLPEYQVKILNYIQMALNPMDSTESSLSKELKGIHINCKCEGSVVLVTYPPEEINETVLKGGFIHRFLFMCRHLTGNERAANAMADIKGYFSTINVEYMKEEIINELNYLKYWISTQEKFRMAKNVEEYFTRIEQLAFNEIKNSVSTKRTEEHLNSIQASTVRKISQIAMHHACLRFSNIIEIEDIKYAWEEVIYPEIITIREYLEESFLHEISVQKEEIGVEKVRLNAHNWMIKNSIYRIPKTDFLRIIGKTYKINSSKTIYKEYNQMLNIGIISEDKEKFVTFTDETITILNKDIIQV